jgi:transcriptional regulator with XRE-family HTH domain
MKINESLKKIRKSKGYSQEYVADYIGIDTTNYGRIERGQTSITFDRMEQLAKLYGLGVVEFVVMLTNSKPIINNENAGSAYFINTIDYLKKEVLFLRESLIARDFQIAHLLELGQEYKAFLEKAKKKI